MPAYTRRLNSHLSGSQNVPILVALILYDDISTFADAGGGEKKVVLEAFGWEIKVCT